MAKMSGFQGLKSGERLIGKGEKTQSSENALYGTIMMDTCHYTFLQNRRVYNTKGEP